MVGDEVMVFVNDEYGYEEFFPANKHWILPFFVNDLDLYFLEKSLCLYWHFDFEEFCRDGNNSQMEMMWWKVFKRVDFLSRLVSQVWS